MFKTKERRFRLDVRRKFFTQSTVRHWLPREAANGSFLIAIKTRLDGTLGNLMWWGATSPRQGLGLDDA